MKSIDDLRKAFFGWRQPLSRDNALRGGIETSRILDKLTDPAPITEAGLRELGVLDELQKKFNVPLPKHVIGELGIMGIKTIGHLRMLLLSVGE